MKDTQVLFHPSSFILHPSQSEFPMNEAVREFLIETHENLAQLELDLVTLERDPTERETLSRVFRTLHTVKGSAGFLGLQKLQAVAHAAESLLSRLRAGELLFNADIASAMLAVVDAVRQMLESVESAETDGDGDYSTLIQTLERLCAATGNAPIPVLPAGVSGGGETVRLAAPAVPQRAANVATGESVISQPGEARPP